MSQMEEADTTRMVQIKNSFLKTAKFKLSPI